VTVDFDCRARQDGELFAAALQSAGLQDAPVHTDAALMAQLALHMRQQQGAAACMLPFCHTVEAEALGAHIRLDGGHLPRAGAYRYDSLEELAALPLPDVHDGRMGQVLQAVSLLRQQGEQVVVQAAGPFTVLGALLDPVLLFRALRRQPETAARVLELLRQLLLQYITAAERAGAAVISYADPAGSAAVLGPRLAAETARSFTLPLLRQLQTQTAADTVIALCPKTAHALTESGCAALQRIALPQPMPYLQAMLALRGQIRFCGQSCIKETAQPLRHLTVLQLTEGEER